MVVLLPKTSESERPTAPELNLTIRIKSSIIAEVVAGEYLPIEIALAAYIIVEMQ